MVTASISITNAYYADLEAEVIKHLTYELRIQGDNEIEGRIRSVSTIIGSYAKDPALDSIYQRFILKSELTDWRGNRDINGASYAIISPMLGFDLPRLTWWGRFAEAFTAPQHIFLERVINKIATSSAPTAIDLGCGNSDSAIYLLKKGWKVIGVDYSRQALAPLVKRIQEINPTWLTTEQIKFTTTSIETYEWTSKVDLIVAGAILPYCNPRSIRNIFVNIHSSLNPGGCFIGDLFANTRGTPGARESAREMGAWFLNTHSKINTLFSAHGFGNIISEIGTLSIKFAAFKT